MNRTPIEWTDYTWNPVSGCRHSCRFDYCYVTQKRTSYLNRFGAVYLDQDGVKRREKNWLVRESGEIHVAREGEIYPFGYDPTFYPHRLNEPLSHQKPARIFVVDVGDLFGAWVPAEWIEQVINVAERCPQHTFQFLTKNPTRYRDFEFPANAWVGTTVTSDQDAVRADIIRQATAPVRFLSIEPLLGEVTFDFSSLQWIILGAQTGDNPVVPEQKWITKVTEQARDLNIPIFMKNNLRPHILEVVHEFPSR